MLVLVFFAHYIYCCSRFFGTGTLPVPVLKKTFRVKALRLRENLKTGIIFYTVLGSTTNCLLLTSSHIFLYLCNFFLHLAVSHETVFYPKRIFIFKILVTVRIFNLKRKIKRRFIHKANDKNRTNLSWSILSSFLHSPSK